MAENYKDALIEIEEIIRQLEEDDIAVDELSEKVKKAAKLITFCRQKLLKTEEEVAKVLKGLEE